MPGVEPSNYRSKTGIEDVPLYYEESWMTVPFDNYEGMTQQQFQDSVAPFSCHGKLVQIEVPKGWRRVEASHPGKHFYVHPSTGAITRFAKEIYDCKRECWISATGQPISAAELEMHPEDRGMMLAYKDAPLPTKAPAVKAAAPPQKKKVEKPAADAAAPEAKAIEAAPEAEAAAIEEVKEGVPAAPAEPPLPVGLLFPGQGSQYVKMLTGVKDLPAVKEMLDTAQKILGYDLLELCMKGPESKLEMTKHCQPAMYVGGLAGIEKLRTTKPERIDRCQGVAGLSLGEYTALTVAGVFSFEQGLKLVKLRGEAMQEAAEASPQSMLSVAGLDQETLQKLCDDCISGPKDVCQIANFLFPNGFSCAGTQSAVEKLMAKAQKTEGCLQAKLLKTSGGFHTKLMEPAKEKLLAALKDIEKEMKPPRCDVYMNVTGKRITPATKPAEIITMLGDQLVSCVQWEPSMKMMIKDGVTEFYECGPQKQLKAMMKRIDPEAWKNTKNIDV
uniref:Malonyl-CoA:ACP transacylase (MAT) domain-containing protein n=1 Tax=Alexandrium catenella TaxID=2925 RepID=A0A7S1RUF4_ALECA